MDVDLILNSIFEEYKAKAIRDGQIRESVEAKLKSVRRDAEDRMKETLDDFLGRPNNERTVQELRTRINQELNQFLDTEISIDSVDQSGNRIDINLSYRPKINVSGISLHGGVTATAEDPTRDILTLQL